MKTNYLILPLFALSFFACQKQTYHNDCGTGNSPEPKQIAQSKLSLNANDSLPIDSARFLLQLSLNEDFADASLTGSTFTEQYDSDPVPVYKVRITGTSLEPSNRIIPQSLESSNGKISDAIRSKTSQGLKVKTIGVEALYIEGNPTLIFKAFVTFCN